MSKHAAWMVWVTAAAVCLTGCTQVDVAQVYQQAGAAAKDGRYEDALALTDRCLRVADDDADFLILHGYCLYQTERAMEAVSFMQRAARAEPDSFLAQYFHGWILFEVERFGDAVAPLENASALLRSPANARYRPYEMQVLVLLGRCCLEKNLYAKGISCLQALRKYKRFREAPEVYNCLGILWRKQQNYENALESFTEAWRRAPGNPIVLQNLAVLHDLNLRKPDEARRFYTYSLAASEAIDDSSYKVDILRRLRQLARER